MPTPFLSIVILNYATRDLLAACLRSIERFAPNAETIVVDNCSPDDSAAMVRRDFSNVQLIALSDNSGFARGMNLGLRQATAPIVFALNADTELTPTTLAPLLDAMAQLPRAGIIAPSQITFDGTHLPSVFSDPTLGNETCRLLLFSDTLAARLHWGAWRVPNYIAPRRVDWVMGAALLFRRECLDAVNGFDESEFMYGEDWDICYRARQLGWHVYHAPNAKIVHHTNAAGKQTFNTRRQARVLAAHLYFHAKHFGRTSRRALALLNLLGASLRLPLIMFSRARRDEQTQVARIAWQNLK